MNSLVSGIHLVRDVDLLQVLYLETSLIGTRSCFKVGVVFLGPMGHLPRWVTALEENGRYLD